MTVDVREHGRRLEELLDGVQHAAGPQAWPRVEALVAALLELYGEGLERVLGAARAEAKSPEALEKRLTEDEIVASLLLLHGLHPVSLQTRIDLALERVASAAPGAAALELASIDDGMVNLRVSRGAVVAMGPTLATDAAVTAIERAAPEVTGVTIEGLAERTDPSGGSSIIPAARLVRRGDR
jgi:hypothetical protein